MKAIVIFSGGIDSTVMLAQALAEGKDCLAISFDYNQRHRIELHSAKIIATHYGVSHRIITIDNSAFQGSSLINKETPLPKDRTSKEIASAGIPSTYVPARNTLFLSYALGLAEIYKVQEIHFGANALDYNPYPDCRPAYFTAFQGLVNLATKQAVEGQAPQIVTPLLQLSKSEIIVKGLRLKAPLDQTFSCYAPTSTNEACHTCDACVLRKEGFNAAHAFLAGKL